MFKPSTYYIFDESLWTGGLDCKEGFGSSNGPCIGILGLMMVFGASLGVLFGLLHGRCWLKGHLEEGLLKALLFAISGSLLPLFFVVSIMWFLWK